MKLILWTILLISTFAGCRSANVQPLPAASSPYPPPQAAPPVLSEITAEVSKDFKDLVLTISDHRQLSDDTQVIRAVGLHKGKPVGLEILIDSDRGELVYRSIGAESDLLVQVIDQVYETRLLPKAMKKEVRFTGMTLEGDPRKLASGVVQFKLFYEGPGDEDSTELYTNIDLRKRRVEITEKDEEHRSAIVRLLKAS